MRYEYYIVVVFFFQAEDGIRDADVTGVQTCALPISRAAPDAWGWAASGAHEAAGRSGVSSAVFLGDEADGGGTAMRRLGADDSGITLHGGPSAAPPRGAAGSVH